MDRRTSGWAEVAVWPARDQAPRGLPPFQARGTDCDSSAPTRLSSRWAPTQSVSGAAGPHFPVRTLRPGEVRGPTPSITAVLPHLLVP